MKKTLAAVMMLGVILVSASAFALAPALTDNEVRQKIIQESVAAYLGTGHPCACPYNSARNGSSCGARSAYSRPGGALLCAMPQM
jgi:hypothetical protein